MKFAACLLTVVVGIHPVVLGTMKPAEPLTAERVRAVLPPASRAPWLDYIQRSEVQKALDEGSIMGEQKALKAKRLPLPPLPLSSSATKSIPLHRPAEFFGTAEARRIGDTIVSFQTPAGGWPKNLDMAGPPRTFGQSYIAADDAAVKKHGGKLDANLYFEYFGTLDNDATTAELRYLGRLATAFPGNEGEAYRKSFVRGVRYLLAAQYPNGGWPQIWPLQGWYHDAVTLNDDAMTQAMEVLSDVAAGKSENADYGFVPAELRAAAGSAATRGLECILRMQIRLPGVAKSSGVATIWGQQYDALTLEPAGARNFEPIALSTGESAHVLLYLMSLPEPSAQVTAAIENGVAWMKAHEISGKVWEVGGDASAGRVLQAKAGAVPLWSRYYSVTTQQPIFGDRDKTIHDDVAELSFERRNGYAWYGTGPQKALDRYESWRKQFAEKRAER